MASLRHGRPACIRAAFSTTGTGPSFRKRQRNARRRLQVPPAPSPQRRVGEEGPAAQRGPQEMPPWFLLNLQRRPFIETRVARARSLRVFLQIEKRAAPLPSWVARAQCAALLSRARPSLRASGTVGGGGAGKGLRDLCHLWLWVQNQCQVRVSCFCPPGAWPQAPGRTPGPASRGSTASQAPDPTLLPWPSLGSGRCFRPSRPCQSRGPGRADPLCGQRTRSPWL